MVEYNTILVLDYIVGIIVNRPNQLVPRHGMNQTWFECIGRSDADKKTIWHANDAAPRATTAPRDPKDLNQTKRLPNQSDS